MKTSRSEYLPVRGLRYHVRHWGDSDAPLMFMLHGWMDVSASFQFVVDALARDWHVVAPDWRGFGASDWLGRHYWFADYLADLEALIGHYAPGRPVDLVGHSMGGMIACLYGGIRPDRVRRIVTLDGFGMAPTRPEMAAERYGRWLDQVARSPQLRPYPDRDHLAARLMQDNPRLKAGQAAFLAEHLGRENADGGIDYAGDPWHKVDSPLLYRLDEVKAIWRQAKAPVLWVAATDSFVMKNFESRPGDYEERLACFADVREVRIDDAGHMVHHDQPERVAAEIEAFLGGV